MRYYRCKCGKRTAWGSMPPYPCSGCPDCGTTLDESPDSHRAPTPHEFIETPVETDNGPQPLTRCRWCHRTKAELAQYALPAPPTGEE